MSAIRSAHEEGFGAGGKHQQARPLPWPETIVQAPPHSAPHPPPPSPPAPNPSSPLTSVQFSEVYDTTFDIQLSGDGTRWLDDFGVRAFLCVV
eukprot:scaffold18947_cov101-Isochrysis_galbana.AAC.1